MIAFALLLALDTGAPAPAFDPSQVGLLRTIAPLGSIELRAGAFSPDGRLLAVSTGREVRLYETRRWTEAGRLEGSPQMLLSLAWSPDGRTLATGGYEGAVSLWNLSGRSLERSLPGHAGHVTCLAYGPDGKRLLSGAGDGKLRVWDLAKGVELNSLQAGSIPHAAAFSKDGRRALVAGDGGIALLWDAEAWAEPKQFQSGEESFVAAGFLRDGAGFWTAGGGKAHVLNGASDRTLELGGTTAQLLPDGRHWVSGGEDGVVRIHDASGALKASLAHHSEAVSAVAVHPQGRLFATLGEDRHVKVWGRPAGGTAKLRPKGFCGIRVQQLAGGQVSIVEVIAGTPAAAAGLQAGDRLLKVGGAEVSNPTETVDQIGSFLEGDELDFEVERAGSKKSFTIRLMKRPGELDR
jgi:WD40 repeat protein